MNRKLYKSILCVTAIVLLVGVNFVQRGLNRDRDELGLTRYTELKGAPPVLALTTVALGGFRGLISNALWIRANNLQDDGKYFEMVQLADWITKLEPHFTQVWLVQAWNMAYNISVKFKDAPDRWRWVQRGIELLRDEGLKYNPHEVLIYRELGWFFQHKMGHNLDDHNVYYKQMWIREMSNIFKGPRPDFEELINPQTDDAKERSRLLREKYKMDPQFMKQVDERYGPLEWRLPETHAIYWAAKGLDEAKRNEKRINPDDLITLRRVIYQSMQMSFHRGRLIENPFVKNEDGKSGYELGPNLDIADKVSGAYEEAMKEDAKNAEHISRGHRNLVRDIVYFLYTNNRETQAAKWYKYLGEKYPDKTILENDTNSFPRNVTLDEYAIGRVQGEVDDTSQVKTKAVIEGLILRSYYNWALGEDDQAVSYERMAQKIWNRYQSKTEGTGNRVSIPPMGEMKSEILRRVLGPESPWPLQMKNQLRTKLNLPAESAEPPPPAKPETPPTSTTSVKNP